MNKAEMAGRLAARTGRNKAVARDAVDGVFAIIGEALADGEDVRVPGFGTVGTRSRQPAPDATRGPARPFQYRRPNCRPSRQGRH